MPRLILPKPKWRRVLGDVISWAISWLSRYWPLLLGIYSLQGKRLEPDSAFLFCVLFYVILELYELKSSAKCFDKAQTKAYDELSRWMKRQK